MYLTEKVYTDFWTAVRNEHSFKSAKYLYNEIHIVLINSPPRSSAHFNPLKQTFTNFHLGLSLCQKLLEYYQGVICINVCVSANSTS